MTQLVPDEWNGWDHTARVGWWQYNLVELGLPNYMPFFRQGKKATGQDAWYKAESGMIWELAENPWHPGRYRWKTHKPEPHPVEAARADEWPLPPPVHEWAERRAEQRKHEQRDSVKSLREAEQIITGDRYNDYGPPAENFGRIATYWNQYLADNPPPLKPSDTAMLMVFVKIAREAAGHKTDSVVDAEGYLAIYEELRNAELKEESE